VRATASQPGNVHCGISGDRRGTVYRVQLQGHLSCVEIAIMSIRVSEKHGVNPCLGVCFYCGEDSGEIGLLGRLPGDKEAPHRAVLSKEPCAKCKDLMKQGIMFICTPNGASGENPERTGQMAVITDEAVKRMGINPPELEQTILKQRAVFIPQDAWQLLGLPNA
jgi:hypothetical protein